jgi:FkbM family methyltransferase
MAYIEDYLYDIFFKEYKVNPGDTVFTIGAGVGEEVEYLSERVGEDGRVFAIEADPDIFNKLKNNVSKYKNQNVILLNMAIHDIVGKSYIVQVEKVWGHSNYISLSKVENSVEVETTTMDKFVKDLNIDSIDYIKINIEGSEKQLLNGFKENFDIVKNWCISCHDFTEIEDQKTFGFVTKFFEDREIPWRKYDSDLPAAKWYVYVSK